LLAKKKSFIGSATVRGERYKKESEREREREREGGKESEIKIGDEREK